MNAQFIRFTTEDALILQGIVYLPSHETKKAYLHIHGMGGNFYENRFIDVMADRIAGIGYAFASVNTRGHDTISDFPIKGDKEEYKRIGDAFEVFEECVLDIRAAINYLEALGYQEIVLCGHSLGAVKVAYYLATSSDARISRLVLMSPPDMVGLAEADDTHGEFTDIAKQMVKDGKGEELLPNKLWGGYYLSAKTYLDLSSRDYPVDVFNLYDEAKSSALEKVAVPTLAFLGEHDDAVIGDPRHALEVIRQKMKSVPSFEANIVESAPHSYFGREEQMTGMIVEWLEKSV